ncbi:MAG: hypothetical protein ABSE81_07230 [Candidatus Omnitrophota bacterium]|jgi:hypothetical protein
MKIKLSLATLIFAFFSSFVFIQSAVSDETLTITTYYPSPYGSYHELRSQRMAIGIDYIQGATYCWPGGTCTTTIPNTASLVVEGNVGIGTPTPVNTLDVESNLAVGADYSGKLAAPSNGAIIEGNVGIGTSSPAAGRALDVNGTINATGYQADGTPGKSTTFTVVKTATGTLTTCTITVTNGIVTTTC